MIPDLLINEMGDHRTLLREALTCILQVWLLLGEKRLQGGKVWKQEAMPNAQVYK